MFWLLFSVPFAWGLWLLFSLLCRVLRLASPFLFVLLVAWVCVAVCLALGSLTQHDFWGIGLLCIILCPCHSVNTFECPFAKAIFTLSLSHHFLLLLLLLFILFGQGFGSENDLIFKIVNKPLFEINQILIIFLLQSYTLSLDLRF